MLRHYVILIAIGLASNPLYCLAQPVAAPRTPATHVTPVLLWDPLPALPDPLGVAGPIVGIHDNILLCAGGANFERPVWESTKQWRSAVYTLDLRAARHAWQRVSDLPSPIGYCACASLPFGIVAVGGNDAERIFSDATLISLSRGPEGHQWQRQSLPTLPVGLVYAQCEWLGDRVVVVGGQTTAELGSALDGGWELRGRSLAELRMSNWTAIPACPGGRRAFAASSTIMRPDGLPELLLIGGRRQVGEEVIFLSDCWRYDAQAGLWRACAPVPVPVSAGGAGAIDQRHIALVSGDDGRLFTQTDQLRDAHPGFPRRTWIYDIQHDQWRAGSASHSNQVTTTPVASDGRIWLISGEVRPRVRTSQGWQIRAALE